jgi:hypothetical protein
MTRAQRDHAWKGGILRTIWACRAVIKKTVLGSLLYRPRRPKRGRRFAPCQLERSGAEEEWDDGYLLLIAILL